MPAPWISLEEYQKAERVLAHQRARFGLLVHAIITALLSALLIVIDFASVEEIVSTTQVPWSVFAFAGMGLGLAAHWWFGYLNLEIDLKEQQKKAEERAAQRP
jgi:membrane protein YqaA with SNARE-associated domain